VLGQLCHDTGRPAGAGPQTSRGQEFSSPGEAHDVCLLRDCEMLKTLIAVTVSSGDIDHIIGHEAFGHR